MSRVQLALNVSDIDEAVAFYSKLFATEPAKRKPGYANFAVDAPAAEARAHREPGRRRHAQPPRGRGVLDRRGGRHRGPPRGEGLATATEDTSRVATPCRTRCGSTTPTGRRGRSTRCSPTARRRTATCGRRHVRRRRLRDAELPADQPGATVAGCC